MVFLESNVSLLGLPEGSEEYNDHENCQIVSKKVEEKRLRHLDTSTIQPMHGVRLVRNVLTLSPYVPYEGAPDAPRHENTEQQVDWHKRSVNDQLRVSNEEACLNR